MRLVQRNCDCFGMGAIFFFKEILYYVERREKIFTSIPFKSLSVTGNERRKRVREKEIWIGLWGEGGNWHFSFFLVLGGAWEFFFPLI